MRPLSDELVAEPADDRYHRQILIDWWDQARVRDMRVLVVGAGALGNEIMKLLALLGAGWSLIYDPDRVSCAGCMGQQRRSDHRQRRLGL